MRWVVFLAAGGEGNWQSKFRQAHPIPHLSTPRADTAGNGRRTFPKFPTTTSCPWFRKAMQKWRKGESVSLTMSLHDLWEAAVRASASTSCPLLPKSFADSSLGWWGLISRSALLMQCPLLAPRQYWLALKHGADYLLSILASSVVRRIKKAKTGDSSCEEDIQSPRHRLKQAITSQVRTFQWQAALGWEKNKNWVGDTFSHTENMLQELANLNEKLMKI